jgi:hypothetical protein
MMRDPLRAASETIGSAIDAALNRRKPAEVVNLRKDQK